MSQNSSILELETLNKEYQLTLKQYNKATSDYLELTKKTINDTAGSSSSYIGCYGDTSTRAMPNTSNNQYLSMNTCKQLAIEGGYAYYADQNAGYDSSNNPIGWCAASNDLSQAKQYGTSTACQTLSDNIIHGGAWANAIYATNVYADQEKQLLTEIDKLNNKLSQLASNIITIDEQTVPTYNKTIEDGRISNIQLKKHLEELNAERDKIKKSLDVMNDLNTEENDGDITVTSNYYIYIIFLIFTVLCVVGLGLMVVSSSSKSTSTGQMGGFKFFKKR
jgi:prefoldin subunit 5